MRALDGFEHGGEVDIVYRSFELDPFAPKDATTATAEMLASKYGMSSQQARDMQRQMEERAAGDGLTFRMADLQESIFDSAGLGRFAAEAGLDSAEAGKVLAGDEFGQEVDADEAMARKLGITGVPFYVIDRRYGISGAQPAETLTQALHRAWSDAHAA